MVAINTVTLDKIIYQLNQIYNPIGILYYRVSSMIRLLGIGLGYIRGIMLMRIRLLKNKKFLLLKEIKNRKKK